nr:immunoglobulin heavy chain junction region [Macaca mulatta]
CTRSYFGASGDYW